MAGSKSDFFENEVLKIATGQTGGLTLPVTPYVALFTGTLTGDSPGQEATGGGYARVSSAGKWAAPADGSVTNNAPISFAQFNGSVSAGAPFTHFGIFDAASGGNALYYGTLTDETKTGAAGDTITFSIGAIVLTES